jgi:hypothetical protein
MEKIIKNENEFMEKESFSIKDYYDSLSQKQLERMDFEDFLLDAIKWQEDVIIIRGEDMDEYKKIGMKDDDYEIKMQYTDGIDFYKKFKEITGVGLEEFDKDFISAKYIDLETENSMNLIIKVNGINQRFIIDKM